MTMLSGVPIGSVHDVCAMDRENQPIIVSSTSDIERMVNQAFETKNWADILRATINPSLSESSIKTECREEVAGGLIEAKKLARLMLAEEAAIESSITAPRTHSPAPLHISPSPRASSSATGTVEESAASRAHSPAPSSVRVVPTAAAHQPAGLSQSELKVIMNDRHASIAARDGTNSTDILRDGRTDAVGAEARAAAAASNRVLQLVRERDERRAGAGDSAVNYEAVREAELAAKKEAEREKVDRMQNTTFAERLANTRRLDAIAKAQAAVRNKK